jgi:hypothetical protein
MGGGAHRRVLGLLPHSAAPLLILGSFLRSCIPLQLPCLHLWPPEQQHPIQTAASLRPLSPTTLQKGVLWGPCLIAVAHWGFPTHTPRVHPLQINPLPGGISPTMRGFLWFPCSALPPQKPLPSLTGSLGPPLQGSLESPHPAVLPFSVAPPLCGDRVGG